MFYWQLIPRGWQQNIDKSTLTVHLPVAAQADVKCAIGNDPSTGCTAEGGGTKDLTVTTGPIAARTPVTIATGLDMATPDPGHSVPWTGRWDRVLRSHLPLLVFVLPRRARRHGVRLDPRRQVAGEATGLPGPLRAARGHRAGAGEVHLQRDRRPLDVRRHSDARCREGRGRPDPRRRRPGRSPTRPARRAGPGSTRSPPTPRTSSAGRARRSPPARRTCRPGCGSRTRSPGSTAASRPGPSRPGTWSAAASAASAGCWCWPASA